MFVKIELVMMHLMYLKQRVNTIWLSNITTKISIIICIPSTDVTNCGLTDGSITIIAVTTLSGGDITHAIPDNTGYITEGQFYLHDGVIDPFGSLSRLKQHVIGKETREDHGQIMNTMIRYYSDGVEAEQKQAMAFDLSDYDLKLLKFVKKFLKVKSLPSYLK